MTSQEFAENYGREPFSRPQGLTEGDEGYFSRVAEGVKGGFDVAKNSLTNYYTDVLQDKPISGKKVWDTGREVALGTSRAVASPIMEAPGLKQLGQGLNAVGQAAVNTKVGQRVTSGMAKTLGYEALANTTDLAETGLNAMAVQGTAKAPGQLKNYVKSKVNTPKASPVEAPKPVQQPLKSHPQSVAIVDRMTRVTPTARAKFQRMAGGKTHGEYATERNMIGTPEEMVTQAFDRWIKSTKISDNALAELKGTFEPSPVRTMLKEALARAERTSSSGAPSPYLRELQAYMNKSGKGGWTMGEINQIKRIYERTNRLDYIKSNLPESVEKANNLDSAVRNWQVEQGSRLGLKNLDKLRKETQLAKMFMDDVGKANSSRLANNAMSITDWIMLSGGDVRAIAGLFAKKVFSSEGVQAAFARNFNKGRGSSNLLEADLQPSEVKALPAGNPGDFAKQPINPKTGQPYPIDLVPKKMGPASSMEPRTPTGSRTSYNPKTGDSYIRDINTGKVRIENKNSTPARPATPQPIKTQESGAYQNNVTASANKTAPITNTSNRTISQTVPQKKGLIQRAVDYYKDTPNKQGGFVRFSKENIPKNIPPDTLGTMRDFVDYVDGFYKPSAEMSQQLVSDGYLLAERFGAKGLKTDKAVANYLEKVLDGTDYLKKK